jgi:hypothetical protein
MKLENVGAIPFFLNMLNAKRAMVETKNIVKHILPLKLTNDIV